MSEDDLDAAGVGAVLAELRRRSGLTGHQLGERVGMSQAKISKIESGVTVPKTRDVIALARALEAPAAVIRRLVDRTESAQESFGAWRDIGSPSRRANSEIAALEQQATEIRTLSFAGPSGLLHTESYARAVIGEYTRPLRPDDRPGEPRAIVGAVTDRVRRQEILADPGKVFLFLIFETALLHQVAKPAVMLGQVERIREVAAQENAIVRVLRFDAPLEYPPLHDFELVDGKAAIVDTMTTTVVTRDQSELQVYRRVYESLYRQATPDIEPILNRYALRYAELARAEAGTSSAPAAMDLLGSPEDGPAQP